MLLPDSDPDAHAEILQNPLVRGDAEWSTPNAAFLAWLERIGVPSQLRSLLGLGLPENPVDFGFWRLSVPDQIMRAEEEDAALLTAKLLPMGSCLCGDPIVLDFTEPLLGAVGFVSHEEYWGSDGEDPREFVRYVSFDWTAFLVGIAKDALPIDAGGMWSDENCGLE